MHKHISQTIQKHVQNTIVERLKPYGLHNIFNLHLDAIKYGYT